MPRILVAPTAFKGTLTPSAVASAIAAGLKDAGNDTVRDLDVYLLPLADGGDGTVETLHMVLGGKLHACQVAGATGKPGSAAWLDVDDMAVVELASACGIAVLSSSELQPMSASTYGLGEVLRDCLDKGLKRIVIALGGSASTDGGAGALAALGARFLDGGGVELPAGGGAVLSSITACDLTALKELCSQYSFALITDVTNPLLGVNGAAAVYARQKGANDRQVEILEEGLANFADVLERTLGIEGRDKPGTGAAGGAAFGLSLALSAEIICGFEWISRQAGLDRQLAQSDLVITGEGCFDRQSLQGKVTGQLIERCRLAKRRIWVVCASAEDGLDLNNLGVERLLRVSASGRPVGAEDLSRAIRAMASEI